MAKTGTRRSHNGRYWQLMHALDGGTIPLGREAALLHAILRHADRHWLEIHDEPVRVPLSVLQVACGSSKNAVLRYRRIREDAGHLVVDASSSDGVAARYWIGPTILEMDQLQNGTPPDGTGSETEHVAGPKRTTRGSKTEHPQVQNGPPTGSKTEQDQVQNGPLGPFPKTLNPPDARTRAEVSNETGQTGFQKLADPMTEVGRRRGLAHIKEMRARLGNGPKVAQQQTPQTPPADRLTLEQVEAMLAGGGRADESQASPDDVPLEGDAAGSGAVAPDTGGEG